MVLSILGKVASNRATTLGLPPMLSPLPVFRLYSPLDLPKGSRRQAKWAESYGLHSSLGLCHDPDTFYRQSVVDGSITYPGEAYQCHHA